MAFDQGSSPSSGMARSDKWRWELAVEVKDVGESQELKWFIFPVVEDIRPAKVGGMGQVWIGRFQYARPSMQTSMEAPVRWEGTLCFPRPSPSLFPTQRAFSSDSLGTQIGPYTMILCPYHQNFL